MMEALQQQSTSEQEETASLSAASQPPTVLLMRLGLIGASIFATFYALGNRVLTAWDESIYAEVAKEMVKRQGWLTPHWNFQPWFEKPPLLMWLTALIYRLFGVSEVSARALGALCGVATIWLTFEIGRRQFGDWGGFAAALILLTNGFFLFVSRFGALDMPLVFCFTLAAYGYVRVQQDDRRSWYIAGAAVGMAIMIKGAAGLLAPLSLCLALVLDHRLGQLRSREVRNAALLACAIALPWHLAMLVSHGRLFLHEYLGYHVLARMKGIESHSEPVYFYLWTYWQAFLPFAVVALLGLLLYIKGQRTSSIIVSFVLVVTVTFTVIGTKMETYAVPSYPFIALLAAFAMQRLLKSPKYALVVAALIFSLYWFLQRAWVHADYSNEGYAFIGSIYSQQEPLMRLLNYARAGDQDLAPAPLILCLDPLIYRQQPLFYTNRPIVQSFLSVPPDLGGETQLRYRNPVPLGQAVTSRPSPIIVGREMYPKLAYSEEYGFVAVAQSDGMVLGEVSRR